MCGIIIDQEEAVVWAERGGLEERSQSIGRVGFRSPRCDHAEEVHDSDAIMTL
jgi:hypothetical protein